MPWLLAGAPSDGFVLNVLKQFLGYLVYLEISKRRYKRCICSVILGQLESFRNYKGFSIFFPKIFRWNLKFYESENSSDSSRDNSSHLATPPLVSLQDDVWETSAETPYWWCVTTQIWIVLLIVGNLFHPISSTAYELWHIISMGFLLSFLRRNFAGKQVLACQI